MSNFCFYLGDNEEIAERMRTHAAAIWGDVKEVARGPFRLFLPSADCSVGFAESQAALGAISGYVRCDSVKAAGDRDDGAGSSHNRAFINTVIENDRWPLGQDWTGSFGAVAYSKAGREVVACNDPVGYIPVYYSAGSRGVLGGTSLIVLGRTLGCEADVVGVLERLTSPYCTYGRRTLLKGVSRLLPGERVRLSCSGTRVISTFDNELCGAAVDSDINEVARRVWDCLQRETDLALDAGGPVYVALSGGWDSRLALATVARRNTEVRCLTFGSPSLHEVRTARRCALAVGASHESFPIETTYFPPRERYESFIRQAETANQLQWCTIIDAFNSDGRSKETILMGDLCESIVALNMKQFSTRDARVRTFAKGLVGQREQIESATEAGFARWKDATRARVVGAVLKNIDKLSPALAEACQREVVAEEIAGDLDLCFSRVRDNRPAFAPMFEELFYWFHRARFLIAGQALFLSSRFRPLCPAVSLRFMRLISTVHPRLRIRRGLMNAIARLPEFDALAQIPSAQIPWLSARAPARLREVVWGLRSGMDQVLIKRAIKNRNPKMRQRVLPTLDYMKEYQREDAVPNVQDWFSGEWLNAEKYVDLVRRRASLAAWPLMNLDIAAPANVSILLDLCAANQTPAESAAYDTETAATAPVAATVEAR